MQFFVAVKVRETRQLYLKVASVHCGHLTFKGFPFAGSAISTDLASTAHALSISGHTRTTVQNKDIIYKHSSSFTLQGLVFGSGTGPLCSERTLTQVSFLVVVLLCLHSPLSPVSPCSFPPPFPPSFPFFRRLVFPGAIASVEFTLRAHSVGSFHLLVSMFCDQLTDVRGHTVITVAKPSLHP